MEKQCKKEQMFRGGGTEHTENPVFKEKNWYQNKIIDTVSQINDEWILTSIYDFIVGMTKEGS